MNDSGLNSVHKDFTYHFTKCAIIFNITMYFARVTVLKKIDTKQNYVVQQCDDYAREGQGSRIHAGSYGIRIFLCGQQAM